MRLEVFRKLAKSKWLPWVGMAPFVIIPVVMMFGGETFQGIAVLALIASMWAGIILGDKFTYLVAGRVLKANEQTVKRARSAGTAFGFLFVPASVATFLDATLGTEILSHPLSVHFLWACAGAALFDFAASRHPK